MLRYQMKGLIDSWAVRSYYSQSKQNRYTVHPCKSLITNIGTDGSGTHFTEVTNRYDSEMCEDFCYKFTHDLAVDRKIMRACRKIVDRSIVRRLKRIISNLLGKMS